MSQPEAKFKRKLVEAFEEVYPDKRSWSAFVAGLNKDGVPDLVFHALPPAGSKGRTLWVEAKHADNAISAEQRLQLLRLRGLGVSCCALRCDMGVDKQDRLILLYQARQVGPTICLDMIHSYPYLDMRTKTFWEGLFAL